VIYPFVLESLLVFSKHHKEQSDVRKKTSSQNFQMTLDECSTMVIIELVEN
jgi:hypothetical protein